MIPQKDRKIKKRATPELSADQSEYQLLLDDMIQNSGLLIPDPNWLMTEDTSRPAETYDQTEALKFAASNAAFTKASKMKDLMHAWVGSSNRPTQMEISRYFRFLQHCDALDLWPANMAEPTDAVPIFRQDLGSLMDLNLLYAFSASSREKPTRILEIGGGYGRLAEAAFNIFGRTVQYVIIDSVPASLFYAKKYLSYACPDARVRSYYDAGNHFDLDRCDIAIVPAWHFERVNMLCYDVCVNIESMQEMNQHHVDYYLNLFETVGVDGATIYLSNAHDYYFRGSFNYPRNWQKLFCANTPRSWTPDHPTEIFRKSSQDYSFPNRISDALHKYNVSLETDPLEPATLHGATGLGTQMITGMISRTRRNAGRVARK